MQSALHILFLDDHAGVRNGTGFLLSQKNAAFKFYYAASAEEGKSVLKQNASISLAIIDLNLDGADGLVALKTFRAIRPELSAIAFTMYADPIHIESALTAGVQGYITKNAEIEELENAILTVSNGGTCFNKAATKIMQALLSSESAKNGEKFDFMNYKSLTKAEQEVFTLLAEKKEPSEIARILGKKEKTVQDQKSIIYQKLSIRDRLELVEFAKNIGVLV